MLRLGLKRVETWIKEPGVNVFNKGGNRHSTKNWILSSWFWSNYLKLLLDNIRGSSLSSSTGMISTILLDILGRSPSPQNGDKKEVTPPHSFSLSPESQFLPYHRWICAGLTCLGIGFSGLTIACIMADLCAGCSSLVLVSARAVEAVIFSGSL